MAVTLINSTTGSVTSGATSGTLTLTALSAAPTTGQWIFVAFMGNDPTNVVPNPTTTAAKCGSINLNLIDPGYTAIGSRVPVLYGAPYQSGMSTAVTVTWNNSSGNSRGMYASCLVISGAAATPVTAYAHLKSFNANGLFDGSSGSNDLGVTSTSNGTTQSSGAMLSWTNSAGIQTSYDTQKQPFILATWNGVSAYSAAATISGATTIVNGQPTTTGQSAGTIALTSAAGYPSAGTPVYVITNNGVCPISYTSISFNNLVGCTVYGGSASGFYNYATNLNGAGVSINYPMLIQTSTASGTQPLNGFQMGTGTTSAIYALGKSVATAGVTGVQAAGQLTLSFGQSSGLTSTPAYLVTAGSGNPCGAVMVTLVPSTRTMTRTSTAPQILTNLAAKAKKAVRSAIALMTRAALASKTVQRVKAVNTTDIRAARASRTAAFVRTTAATMFRSALALKFYRFNKSAKSLLVNTARASKMLLRIKKVSATFTASSGFARTLSIKRAIKSTLINASREGKVVFYYTFNVASSFFPGKEDKIVRRIRQVSATFVGAGRAARVKTVKKIVYSTQVLASKATKALKANKYSRAAFIGSSFIVKKTSKNFFALMILPAKVSRQVVRRRSVSASMMASANVTKRVASVRGVSVTATWPVNARKSTKFRRAVKAVATAVAKHFFTTKIISHPGQVGGAVYTAILGGNIVEPSVSAQTMTAVVGSTVEFPDVSAKVLSPAIGAEIIFSE